MLEIRVLFSWRLSLRFSQTMTRRELLAGSAAAAMLRRVEGTNVGPAQNLSYPLRTFEGNITPADRFFVRDHFHEPDLSLTSWRLKIEGRVAKPQELTLADIIESPTKKVEALLECAGNAAGGPAASNGEWEGVPLAHVLQRAGVEANAAFVMLQGSDAGKLLPSAIAKPYTRLMPISKCQQAESLLVFKLNDKFLTRKNGFPVRALFPGWYAMDSVKWLQRIVVLGPDDPHTEFEESGMTRVYNRVVETPAGERTTTRLTSILVKSAIAWPENEWKLPAARHNVYGFAWTGSGLIRRVDISTDGGRSWMAAKLEGNPQPFRWIRWSYSWLASPGEHVLMSRATDSNGKTQPLESEASRKDGYELNFCAKVRCSVQ